jgi:conjugative relaxase-like TrwC/TraI family protein
VLSIGKCNGEQATYYEDAVAQSREDYYNYRGEAQGNWWGKAAESLELRGELEPGQLGTMVAGRDPAAPENVLAPDQGGRKNGAYDLTFSVPKSVTLLRTFGDEETRRIVDEEITASAKDGLAYLEEHACQRRRGAGGAKIEQGDGFLAAMYRHRTSRPVDMEDGSVRIDPQAHVHCLVANHTRSTVDGARGALDAAPIYRLAKTDGYLFQASMRERLTRRLGVDWTPVTNGTAEIKGLETFGPAFSTRREQIREHATEQARQLMVESGVMTAGEAERAIDADRAMEMLGSDGMRVATLASRQAKGAEGSEEDLQRGWARTAAEAGMTPRHLTSVLGQVVIDSPEFALDRRQQQAVLEELTQRASTFTRHDVLRAMAQHAPRGASPARLNAAIDELLSDQARVRTLTLADRHGTARYTTPEVQEQEQRIVDTFRRRAAEGAGVIPPEIVDRVLREHPELANGNGEQAEMVRRLATGGAGVSTVEGPAGSGKTRGLRAFVAAAEADGRHIVGAAFTGAAAKHLGGDTGAPSFTIHRLLGDWRDRRMPDRAVVIVDEAAAVSRKLDAELHELAARDGTKLILVGDPKQLPNPDAGGLFRLVHDFGQDKDKITLTTNRRQIHEEERKALALVRAGETDEAVRLYAERGQLVKAPSAVALREQMVADWFQSKAAGKDTLLLGQRRVDVDLLNQLARQKHLDAGLLDGPSVRAKNGQDFQRGDEVIFTKNCYWQDVNVRNGQRGKVEEVDLAGNRLRVALGNEEERWIPLDRYSHVDYGWAMTANKAQGQTIDEAFIMRPGAAGSEWHYVAASRGREPMRYYLVDEDREADAEGTSHAGERQETRTREEELAAQWRREDVQELAADFERRPDVSDARPLDQTPAGRDQTEAEPAAGSARTEPSTQGRAGAELLEDDPGEVQVLDDEPWLPNHDALARSEAVEAQPPSAPRTAENAVRGGRGDVHADPALTDEARPLVGAEPEVIAEPHDAGGRGGEGATRREARELEAERERPLVVDQVADVERTPAERELEHETTAAAAEREPIAGVEEHSVELGHAEPDVDVEALEEPAAVLGPSPQAAPEVEPEPELQLDEVTEAVGVEPELVDHVAQPVVEPVVDEVTHTPEPVEQLAEGDSNAETKAAALEAEDRARAEEETRQAEEHARQAEHEREEQAALDAQIEQESEEAEAEIVGRIEHEHEEQQAEPDHPRWNHGAEVDSDRSYSTPEPEDRGAELELEL